MRAHTALRHFFNVAVCLYPYRYYGTVYSCFKAQNSSTAAQQNSTVLSIECRASAHVDMDIHAKIYFEQKRETNHFYFHYMSVAIVALMFNVPQHNKALTE